MLNRDDLPGHRAVQFFRTSNKSSDAESSLNRQENRVNDEYQILEDRFDAEKVRIYRVKESASTMDRPSLNEILELAENDEFDILMVWAIHRLTRANIYETLDYLLKLRETGIIIYSHQDGYFDWEDHNDARRMFDHVINARIWRNSLVDGAVENNIDSLLEGHWPYGPLGYALKDREDEGIVIKEGYEWVPEATFKIFRDERDASEVKEILEEKIREQDPDLEPPSVAQINTMLENELYTGQLVERKSGQFVREKEEIAVLDIELFEQVQELLENPENDDSPDIGPQDFPMFIYELIARLGQEYIVENVSAIRWCCPKCGSANVNASNGTIKKWGFDIPQIYCNEDDCYNGPAIRIKDLEKIDRTLPYVCPECQRTDDFDVEQTTINQTDEMYRYTCRHCNESMLKRKGPDAAQRGLESSNAISLRGSGSVGQKNNSDSQSEERSQKDSKVSSSNVANGDNSDHSDIVRQEDSKISDTDVFNSLREVVSAKIPRSETARDVIIDTAEMLHNNGPLTAEQIKRQLWNDYEGDYASQDSLWESTVMRFFDELPGFTKPGYNRYNFNHDEIKMLLEGWVENNW